MSELLKCTDLTKVYAKGVTALDSVNLSLPAGKIIGLLGPNGSGKTTLIKLAAGLLTPTSGTIEICSMQPGPETSKLIAYLPDKNYLNSWMRVKQIVQYFSDFFEDFRPELALEMLAKLGIDPKHQLKTLSKGNKEKVCLILTMSRNAKLYLLDEPIAGVDPATRDYIIQTIIGNYNPEASVVLSTHLIQDIESVLDDVVFIQNGKIVLHESVEDIRTQYQKSVDGLFREVFRW